MSESDSEMQRQDFGSIYACVSRPPLAKRLAVLQSSRLAGPQFVIMIKVVLANSLTCQLTCAVRSVHLRPTVGGMYALLGWHTHPYLRNSYSLCALPTDTPLLYYFFHHASPAQHCDTSLFQSFPALIRSMT